MKYTPTPGLHPGVAWIPSNGTDGASFQESWCHKCARDKVLAGLVDEDHATQEDYCPILMATYNEPDAVVEWRELYDNKTREHSYVCIAFIDANDPVPPERCPNTIDMFPEEPRP